MKIVLLIIALMISVQAATASGIGIGVSPGNMSFKLAPEMSAEQSLYVINTGSETARYEIFVDDSTYDNWFTFSPSSFDLRAGEKKEVKVTLKAPAFAEANVECKIKIPCTVSGSVVGAGIIVPVHIEIDTLEGNYSEEVSSSGISSGGGYPESDNNLELKEALQQFVVNNSHVRFDLTQNITRIGEKIKDSAENLEVIASKSLDDTIKSLDEKYPGALAEIENHEEKFRALPGFDTPLAGAGLVISGLLMRRRLFN